MFYEEKPAARPEHPAYFLKCQIKVGNAAHRPRGNDRIDVCIADWNSFCSAFDLINRQCALWSGLVGHLQELWRWIDPDNLLNTLTEERQVRTGTDTDLQNLARRPRDHAITVRQELGLLHRKMRQPWHHMILVKSHERVIIRPKLSLSTQSCLQPLLLLLL